MAVCRTTFMWQGVSDSFLIGFDRSREGQEHARAKKNRILQYNNMCAHEDPHVLCRHVGGDQGDRGVLRGLTISSRCPVVRFADAITR
jgi:hypothetical protein